MVSGSHPLSFFETRRRQGTQLVNFNSFGFFHGTFHGDVLELHTVSASGLSQVWEKQGCRTASQRCTRPPTGMAEIHWVCWGTCCVSQFHIVPIISFYRFLSNAGSEQRRCLSEAFDDDESRLDRSYPRSAALKLLSTQTPCCRHRM